VIDAWDLVRERLLAPAELDERALEHVLGGMLGPPVVGAAMDLAGPSGLPWSLSAAYLLLIAVAALRHLQGRRRRRGLRGEPLDSP